VKLRGWDGSDEHDVKPQWSFAGALLYAVTVVTTIGKSLASLLFYKALFTS